jgi:pilus assembly protein Flp/PilA
MNTLRAMRGLRQFFRDDRGTTAIEYAIIATGVSVAIIGAVTAVGSALMTGYYDKLINLF